jgi:hypothetical protein
MRTSAEFQVAVDIAVRETIASMMGGLKATAHDPAMCEWEETAGPLLEKVMDAIEAGFGEGAVLFGWSIEGEATCRACVSLFPDDGPLLDPCEVRIESDLIPLSKAMERMYFSKECARNLIASVERSCAIARAHVEAMPDEL